MLHARWETREQAVVDGAGALGGEVGTAPTGAARPAGPLTDDGRLNRTVIDAIPSLVAYWGGDLRCRFANKAYYDWFGKHPDDLIGTVVGDLLGEALFTLNEPHLRAALAGERRQFERVVQKADGSRVETVTTYIPDDVGGKVRGFVVMVTDVTSLKATEGALRLEIGERERAETLLRDSQAALQEAQRLGQIGSWHWRVADDVTTWSDELHRIMGSDPGLPSHFADHASLFAPESWARLRRAVDEALETGKPYLLDLEFVRPDGRHGWLEARGEALRGADGLVVALSGTAQDITARRHADGAMRKTQDFLERTGAVAGVGGWEVDLATGAATWSDQTCKIHDVEPGHSPTLAEAIGYYTPAARGVIERAVREGIEHGRPWDLELELVSAKGRPFWARATGTAEFEDGKPVRLLGAFQDITAALQVRRQLGEKSANLQATLDHMEQGIVKLTADRKVQLVNRRFSELLDLPIGVAEAKDADFDDILALLEARGEFVDADEDLRRRVRDKGRPLVPGTHERVRPNGQVIEVVTAPLPDGTSVSTYSDITARRRAEGALRESEARYRMLADATSDVITQLDLGFVRRYASPACRAMLGYEPEEMIGLQPSATIHPDDAPMVRDIMERLVSGAMPGDRATATNRMRHKLGHWVWLEAGINLVRDGATGAPKFIVCSLRDVTERQRVAHHLEVAKAAAEKATRAKSEFLANMSHELRTPLTGILGVLDVLMNDRALAAPHRRLVGLASESGRSLLTIVNDVLDLSKMEEGQLVIEAVPFDLEALVERCVGLARESLRGKPVVVTARIEPDPPGSWIGDSSRLGQILLNLLTNAVKFTERGRVEVEAVFEAAAGLWRFEVRDTGIGIPADRLGTLFERFTQADASITRLYGGSGLGLAISKRLLTLMGGRIGVEARPGGGSTFWFDVPLARERPAAAAAAADPRAGFASGFHILLAEDNPLNREILETMLTVQGHRVTAVADGAAALAAARSGTPFDAILMDVQMPVMDGLTATSALRREHAANGRRMPVIGLTANAMAEDIAACHAAGMDAHVAKPVKWPVLFKTLTDIVASRGSQGGAAVTAGGRRILDPGRLDTLARSVGRERVSDILGRFVEDLRRRQAAFDALTPPDLAQQAHAIGGLGGTLGFMDLADLCAEVEAEARRGRGADRVAELGEAMARAIAAALTSPYAAAA